MPNAPRCRTRLRRRNCAAGPPGCHERARGYCLRVLELRHPGFAGALNTNTQAALAQTVRADVPALFWMGVASGGALSLAENQLRRIGELVLVRATLLRALELDETWEHGAIHEVMIALDGLSPLLGGSAARARQHFERAVTLSGGASAFAYVTLASSVAQPARDRAEFERSLRAALAMICRASRRCVSPTSWHSAARGSCCHR